METLSYCQLMERMLAAEARVVELESGKVGNALLECENHHVEVVGKLTERITELTAENVALKLAIPEPRNVEFDNDSMDDVSLAEDVGFNDAIGQMKINISKTPTTARIVAGIKADGVEEFASYISLYNSSAERHAINFAKQLRECTK